MVRYLLKKHKTFEFGQATTHVLGCNTISWTANSSYLSEQAKLSRLFRSFWIITKKKMHFQFLTFQHDSSVHKSKIIDNFPQKRSGSHWNGQHQSRSNYNCELRCHFEAAIMKTFFFLGKFRRKSHKIGAKLTQMSLEYLVKLYKPSVRPLKAEGVMTRH